MPKFGIAIRIDLAIEIFWCGTWKK